MVFLQKQAAIFITILRKSDIILMNLFKKIADWAEKNKFWSDIMKGILAAILVATIIEIVKNDVGYSAEKNKARLSLKVTAIKDFAEKSYKYTSLAVRYKEGKVTYTDLRDAFDNYRAAEHLMNVSLGDPYILQKT